MNKLLLGRYLPGDSVIHQLDSRAKLVASFYFIGLIFFANNWLSFGVVLAFTLFCVLLSKINLTYFLNGVKPLVWVILFTVVLQMFFTIQGNVLFHWGIIRITDYGILNGIFIFFRFVLIILMSTLLTLTTPPLELADAIEYLLRPLRVVKFPVHELAMMLSIALRFVPLLLDETEKIMNAQRARGVDFGEGNLIQKIKAVVPLLIPLFVSSFTRADELSTAMEARGYQGGEGRSKYRVLKWHWRDSLALVLLIGLTLVLLLVRN